MLMKISIEYCAMWNYLPRASSLEVQLNKDFPKADVSLISSGGGVFEISLDDDLIFSKKSLNRFPEDGEIKKIIMDRS